MSRVSEENGKHFMKGLLTLYKNSSELLGIGASLLCSLIPDPCNGVGLKLYWIKRAVL